MEPIPDHVTLIFVLLSATTFGFITYAAYHAFEGKRNPLALFSSGVLAWLLLTGVLAFKGFYLDFDSRPPRLFLFVIPMVLLIIFLLVNRRTRAGLMRMPISSLTYIHIVRIPVELCLWWLRHRRLRSLR